MCTPVSFSVESKATGIFCEERKKVEMERGERGGSNKGKVGKVIELARERRRKRKQNC